MKKRHLKSPNYNHAYCGVFLGTDEGVWEQDRVTCIKCLQSRRKMIRDVILEMEQEMLRITHHIRALHIKRVEEKASSEAQNAE